MELSITIHFLMEGCPIHRKFDLLELLRWHNLHRNPKSTYDIVSGRSTNKSFHSQKGGRKITYQLLVQLHGTSAHRWSFSSQPHVDRDVQMHAYQASEDDLQWSPAFKQVTLNAIKYKKEKINSLPETTHCFTCMVLTDIF